MTGDPTIDAFNRMSNASIKEKRHRAPSQMNVVEHKLITELLPTAGIGRIVCDSKQNAQYARIRIRKFLKSLNLEEMIASSVQLNEVIVWRIAKYNMWRMKPPIQETQMWKDSRVEEVTLQNISSKGYRNDTNDLSVLKAKVEGAESFNFGKDNIDIEVVKKVLIDNFSSGLITKEEFNKKLIELGEKKGES